MKAAIIDQVQETPGIHFRQLRREVGCSNSTLDYHLQRTEYLRDVEIRSYRRIYPENVPENLYSPLAALNHDTRGPIIVQVQEQQTPTLGKLADTLQKAVSTVSRHMNILADAGLVDIRRHGQYNHYNVTSVTRKAIDQHGKTVLDQASDRFIEMWE